MPSLLDDIVRPELARLANDLKVATVGRVQTFARSTGRAAVRLLASYVTSDGVQREALSSPQAVVHQPRGDGYGVAFDIATDDPGVLIAADSGGWDPSWKTGAPARPQTGQRHTYGSAAFLPGGRLGSEAPANAVGQMRIGAEDGSACVDLERVRAVPLGHGRVWIRGQAMITAEGAVFVADTGGAPTSVRLGSEVATLPVALAGGVSSATSAGWGAFTATIQADATVSPALKLSLAAAAGAALTAEQAVPVGSTVVVASG